jgi:hypothetical protein
MLKVGQMLTPFPEENIGGSRWLALAVLRNQSRHRTLLSIGKEIGGCRP